MGFILSIDQGTTGSTAVLINDETFEFVGKVNKEFPQIFPKPSWVEHNLNDIWDSVEETIKKLLKEKNISPDQISSIGITNQRETTCAFTKDGRPLANAIVWQDRRTEDFCNQIKDSGKEKEIQLKTGLPVDPYFSGTKMRWLLKNNSDVSAAQKSGDLLFGNIDTFLLYKLTNNESHKTEASNASRTLLMNLETCNWDDSLLGTFEVDKKCLPEICDSFTKFGETKNLGFLPDGIPITGILGDQQAALFGQAGFKPGDMKCTYGTGAFSLINTGSEIKVSTSGLLTTVAYKNNGKPTYALEGSAYIAGAAVQWLRDKLNLFDTSPEIELLAKRITSLEEMEHIFFLPFFTGIGSPHWVSNAKAAIVGLTRDSGNEHISRACLDGIAFSINDLIQAMRKDTGLEINSLKVDGGAVANDLLMKIQATVSNLEIIRPKIIETTAYGAALASAIGNGKIDFEKVDSLWKADSSFNSDSNEENFYKLKKEGWSSWVKRLYL